MRGELHFNSRKHFARVLHIGEGLRRQPRRLSIFLIAKAFCEGKLKRQQSTAGLKQKPSKMSRRVVADPCNKIYNLYIFLFKSLFSLNLSIKMSNIF